MSILEEEKIKMKEEIEFAKMKKEEGRVNTSGSVMTMTPFGRMSEQSIFRVKNNNHKKYHLNVHLISIILLFYLSYHLFIFLREK